MNFEAYILHPDSSTPSAHRVARVSNRSAHSAAETWVSGLGFVDIGNRHGKFVRVVGRRDEGVPEPLNTQPLHPPAQMFLAAVCPPAQLPQPKRRARPRLLLSGTLSPEPQILDAEAWASSADFVAGCLPPPPVQSGEETWVLFPGLGASQQMDREAFAVDLQAIQNSPHAKQLFPADLAPEGKSTTMCVKLQCR